MLDLDKAFSRRSGQRSVAEFLIRNGFRVSEDGCLYAGSVKLSDSRVAQVVGVDRRLIRATVGVILGDDRLKRIFTKLGSTPSLGDVAPELGFGAIEIIPTDAAGRGIVASVAGIIAGAGIVIRQIITDDPMFSNAEMTVVTEKPLPRELIDDLLKVKGVKKVIILS